MTKIKNFIFDMDGTIYLGNKPLPGSIESMDYLNDNYSIYFMTNNSTKDINDYKKKLTNLGFKHGLNNIMTSGEACGRYILNNYGKSKIFLLGTPNLKKQFENMGLKIVKAKEADMVVLGFDTTINYNKMWEACDLIRENKPYIATHPDKNCPLPGGKWMPDTGAMMAFFEAATGKLPVVIGKPKKPMYDAFVDAYGIKAEETIVVGDRLYTDMKFGNDFGFKTMLVLTGETSMEMYKKSDVKVNYIVDGIHQLKGKKFLENLLKEI